MLDQADVYNPGHATMIHLANPGDRVTACGLATRAVDPHGARAGNIDSSINCHQCRKIIDSLPEQTCNCTNPYCQV